MKPNRAHYTIVVDYTRHGYTTFRSVESALQLVRDF